MTTAGFVVGSACLFVLARTEVGADTRSPKAWSPRSFDTAVVTAYVLVYAFERGTPTQQVLYIDLAAACVRFQIPGGLVLAAVSAPIVAGFEKVRVDYLHVAYSWKLVALQTGLELVMALIVGWLVRRLAAEGAQAEARADEAEMLRDELGRRADLADAANRCAHALSSSLEASEAFGAFIRELRGLLPFDRVAILIIEDGVARLIASAGVGVDEVFPVGFEQPVEGSLLEAVIATGAPVYRAVLDGAVYPEEAELARLGLGSRLAAPLLAGTHAIGMLSRPAEAGERVHALGSRARRAARAPGRHHGSRTSGPTTPSDAPSRSSAGSRRCAPTSSRSSRTRCAPRWRP